MLAFRCTSIIAAEAFACVASMRRGVTRIPSQISWKPELTGGGTQLAKFIQQRFSGTVHLCIRRLRTTCRWNCYSTVNTSIYASRYTQRNTKYVFRACTSVSQQPVAYKLMTNAWQNDCAQKRKINGRRRKKMKRKRPILTDPSFVYCLFSFLIFFVLYLSTFLLYI